MTLRMKSKCLLVLTGPTGVGKTDLSIEIAQKLNAEILSADARQFYHQLKIGTAAPPQHIMDAVKHHFVGHLSIHDYYNVAIYEKDALKLLDRLFQRSDYALLVGGSGLYINTLCYGIDEMPDPNPAIRDEVQRLYKTEGLKGLRQWLRQVDPIFYANADPANPQRLMRALEVYLATGKPYTEHRSKDHKARPFMVKMVVLNRPRLELYQRINQRVGNMIGDGLIEETLQLFPYRHLNALKTVGYRELFDWMANKYSLSQAVEKIKTHTRRYAKRQQTWFKRYEHALSLHPSEKDAIIKYALEQS